ncbi:MAG: prepilin peptidase [Defluviitaleaceae bacterium]|nr:prepilin peptidase [Defluviitaleaceae bacterium]
MYIFMGLLGLCFGSFANVLIYRVPRKISVIFPPSHCTFCKKRLSFLDLLPIISYMAFLGKCRYCKTTINKRYPIIEVLCAVLFAANAHFTSSLSTFSIIPLTILVFVLLCISAIDYETQTIPDIFVIILAISGIFWVMAAEIWQFSHILYNQIWQNVTIGMLTGALPLFIIDRLTLILLKKDGFGYGDVKLMGVAGLFLGWQLILVAYLFAFAAGGIFGAFLLITHRAKQGDYIAFAPFLSVGIVLALWFGKIFINFYSISTY